LPLHTGNSWTFLNGATIADLGTSGTVTCNGSTYLSESLDIKSNGNEFILDVGRLNGQLVVQYLAEYDLGVLVYANNGCAAPLMQDDGSATFDAYTNTTFTPTITSSNQTQTITAGTIAGVTTLTTEANLPSGTITAGTNAGTGYNVIFSWGFAPGVGFTAFGITNNFAHFGPITLTPPNGSRLTTFMVSPSSY
jgi:hypothetical protein